MFDFLIRMIGTPFTVGWSRPEADLRQDNPSLKHFGSALMNQSTWNRLLFFFLREKKKDGRLTDSSIS